MAGGCISRTAKFLHAIEMKHKCAISLTLKLIQTCTHKFFLILCSRSFPRILIYFSTFQVLEPPIPAQGLNPEIGSTQIKHIKEVY